MRPASAKCDQIRLSARILSQCLCLGACFASFVGDTTSHAAGIGIRQFRRHGSRARKSLFRLSMIPRKRIASIAS
jgi:hypothetical protein